METGDLVPAAALLRASARCRASRPCCPGSASRQESPGLAAAALEFALEGLHLNRRLAKDAVAGRTVYGG